MTNGKIHLVPRHGKWVVRRNGAKRAIAVRSTVDSAVRRVFDLRDRDVLYVHGQDGRIRKRILLPKRIEFRAAQ